MKFILALSLCFLGVCQADSQTGALGLPQGNFGGQQHVAVNNRILATVNGKAISVVDVMKKMDITMLRAYPHLANSAVARYQFYTAQWQEMLSQMIMNELILADAEKIELKVTDADVREKMMERFGPNVMVSLDRLHLSYEEARKMIHSEIVVQRMTWYRINSKALQQVNSQDIKAAYKEFCIKNPPMEEWTYQVLSIRAAHKEMGALLAQKAFALLSEKKDSLQNVVAALKPQDTEAQTVPLSLSLSEEYQANDKTISKAHREVLAQMQPNSYSEPISQVSRVDNTAVHRIFFLKGHKKIEPPPFEKVSEQIYDHLLEETAAKENAVYRAKLIEKFNFDKKLMEEALPSDFQPFRLE